MLKTIASVLILSLVACTAYPPPSDENHDISASETNTLAVPVADGSQSVSTLRIVETQNGVLNLDTLGSEATVEGTFPGMAPNDTVFIHVPDLGKPPSYDTPTQTPTTTGVFRFKLPRAIVAKYLNTSLLVIAYSRAGGTGNQVVVGTTGFIPVVGGQGQQNKFNVVEAPTGELNVKTLGASATVQVYDSRIAAQDTVLARMTGVATRNTPFQTVTAPGTLTFTMPKAWWNENIGSDVQLHYLYKVGGAGSLITSAPLSIRVVSAQGQNVFKVVEAPAGELNADTLGAEANVQVSYPGLAVKDTVGVRLTGVAVRDAPIQTVSTVGVLTFKLPKAWITENKGRTVTLTYTYKVGGAGSLITSAPLSIRVVGAQGQSVFKVVEAPAGELNADTLGAEANVQVSYLGLAVKDTVGVRLTGVAVRDAPIQTVSTVGVLTFKLPKAWITENKGNTVSLTYTYKVGGAGSLITSSPLPVRVIGAVPEGDGQRVANDLNAQYADTRQDCGDASLTAALCSGVILRATINGSGYRAWNPSPLSQKNGGVSFFYLRKDAHFKGFPANYPNTSGFIFFPPLQRPAGSVEVRVLCIFPMDGGSDIRADEGCGVSSNYPTVSRSCEQQGITTAAGWLAHYNQGPTGWKYQRQCGFNVRASQGTLAANAFYQGILAMKLMGGESFNSWNEIRLATWPQNIHTTIPIKAFFYTSNGLADARYNQQDFYKYSNKAIPIIKLTLPRTTAESARFEFIKVDQVVGNWN